MGFEYHGNRRLDVNREDLNDEERIAAIGARFRDIAELIKPIGFEYVGGGAVFCFTGNTSLIDNSEVKAVFPAYTDLSNFNESGASDLVKFFQEHVQSKFRKLPKRRS